MKKSTKLVSAVVVLAVLGGVYVGLNTYVSKEEKTESSEEESKTEVFSVKTDDIKSLEFIVDKKEVTFEKKDDSWVKKDETAFPVNQTTLDSAASRSFRHQKGGSGQSPGGCGGSYGIRTGFSI